MKEKSKKDLQMEEFLDVMKPRTKNGPSWANEATQSEASTSATKLDDPNKEDGDIEMNADQPVRDEALSDAEWMRRRMTNALDDGGKAFEQDDEDAPAEKSDHVCVCVV